MEVDNDLLNKIIDKVQKQILVKVNTCGGKVAVTETSASLVR